MTYCAGINFSLFCNQTSLCRWIVCTMLTLPWIGLYVLLIINYNSNNVMARVKNAMKTNKHTPRARNDKVFAGRYIVCYMYGISWYINIIPDRFSASNCKFIPSIDSALFYSVIVINIVLKVFLQSIKISSNLACFCDKDNIIIQKTNVVYCGNCVCSEKKNYAQFMVSLIPQLGMIYHIIWFYYADKWLKIESY